MKNLGFHFTNGMKLRDGQELIEGKEYIYEGEIKICNSGYHLSRNLLDALNYAPGFTLSLVEFDEVEDEHADKLVCRRRKVIETHDVREIILTLACDVAEEALNQYWNNPEDMRPYDAIKEARKCIKNPSPVAASRAYAAYSVVYDYKSYSVVYDYKSYAAVYAAYATRAVAEASYVDFTGGASYNDATRDVAHFLSEKLLIERLQKVFKNSLVFRKTFRIFK